MFRCLLNRKIPQLLILAILLSLSCPSHGSADTFRRSWPVMGTYAEFVSAHDSPALNRGAEQVVRDVFRRVNETMTVYDKSSDLSHVNASAGQTAEAVDPWLVDIVQKGKRGDRFTSGAFSLNVLVYGVKHGLKPGDVSSYVSPPVDDAQITVNPDRNRVFLKKQGMGLDLGGIAKGYALDRAVEQLRERGLTRFLISLGRNTYAGDPPGEGHQGWPVKLVGEQDPRRLSHRFVSVSEQGLRSDTGHIVDPRSGTIVTDRRRVVVVTSSGWLGDVVSTALMVEPNLRVDLLRQIPRVKRVMIQQK